MRKLSSSFALVVLLTANFALASTAFATYPGENGKIFFRACSSGCSRTDVYSVNPDGTELKNLTEALTAPEGLPDSAGEPSVSADGTRVVFGVDTQQYAEIWVMNADGTEPRRLTNDNLLDWAPAISPDGSRIAWAQYSPFPSFSDQDIWVMNVDGSGQELLFNGTGTDGYPTYTPDGLTVVMNSEEGDMDIRKVSSTPAVPPLMTATAVAADKEQLEYEPNVSPDGARVAFIQVPKSSPFSPFDIYSVGTEGGPAIPVYATAANEQFPAYSPDGNKMVFDSDEVPMVGNADGSGTPVPLEVGGLTGGSSFDWATKPVTVPTSSTSTSNLKSPNGHIGKHPKKRDKKRRARFTFSSDVPGSRFECKLDKRAFRPCQSPFVRNCGRDATPSACAQSAPTARSIRPRRYSAGASWRPDSPILARIVQNAHRVSVRGGSLRRACPHVRWRDRQRSGPGPQRAAFGLHRDDLPRAVGHDGEDGGNRLAEDAGPYAWLAARGDAQARQRACLVARREPPCVQRISGRQKGHLHDASRRLRPALPPGHKGRLESCLLA